jgi:hypothetical protein
MPLLFIVQYCNLLIYNILIVLHQEDEWLWHDRARQKNSRKSAVIFQEIQGGKFSRVLRNSKNRAE